MTCYEIDREGGFHAVDTDAGLARWRAGKASVWLRMRDAPAAEIKALLEGLDLGADATDLLLAPGHGARVLPLGSGIFVEWPIAVVAESPGLEAVSLYWTTGLLITVGVGLVSEQDSDLITVLARSVRGHKGVAGLLGALLAESALQLRNMTADLRLRSFRLAREMDEDTEAVAMVEVLNLKRGIVDLEALAEERGAVIADLIEDLERMNTSPTFDLDADVEHVRVAEALTGAVARRLDRQDRRASDLQARLESHQQDKLNRRLGRLTVISATFLPLTLLAGIYGMNFERMPELSHPYGYPVTLGAMAAIAFGMFLWFRAKGWMD